MARPKDGMQHPDLDKAWADYDAAVAKATESIKAAIAKQFDAATAKGDLDAAEKWQVIGEKFEKAGELPTEKEIKAAVSAANAEYKRATDGLTKAYEAVVKSLTMEKQIQQAKMGRDEIRRLSDLASSRPATQQSIAPDQSKQWLIGKWQHDGPDELVRVFGKDGRYSELFKTTGRVNAVGNSREIEKGFFEVVLTNRWTVYFRPLSETRTEFEAKTPDGKMCGKVILHKTD